MYALKVVNPVRGIQLLALAEKKKGLHRTWPERPWSAYASRRVRLEEGPPTVGPSQQLPIPAGRLVLVIHFSRE
jgi:hypothetical protein